MSNAFTIIIPDFIEPDDTAAEHEILADIGSVVALNAYSEAELAGRIEAADAIMLYHSLSLTPTTIDTLSRCKLIVRCGVGYDNVDIAAAGRRGIPVANVPDYGSEEVADSAIGMALSLARGIHTLNSTIRAGIGPYSFSQAAPLQRLRGKVFGIIGLGRIGTATALRAKAFGMDVAFYDPFRPDGTDKAIGCRRVESLEELLAQSHIVSLHCPLTEATQHMMNRDTIALMPRGSYLVNTSRGAVVDTAALPEALASGQLAGAAIDVLVQEPPPADHPLLAAWRDPAHAAHHRLILNPHSAFYSEQGMMDMRVKGATACRRALLGQPIRNIVNQAALDAR